MNSIVVVDGNNLVWKLAYLTDRVEMLLENKEKNYSPLLMGGIISSLCNFANKKVPNLEKIIICYDSPNNWRKELYKDYKGTRKKEKTIEEVVVNTIKKSVSYLKSLGFFVLQMDKQEADDLAFCVTKKFHKTHNVFLYSADNDWLQMLKFENTFIYETLKNKQKNKVPDILLEKAIIGDNSDNIKGIKGIGKKTYSNFLLKFKEGNYAEFEEHKKIIEFYLKIVDIEQNLFLNEVCDYVNNFDYSPIVISEMKAIGMMKEMTDIVRFSYQKLLQNYVKGGI